MSPEQHARLRAALTPRLTKYNAAEPLSEKQQAGLLLPQLEALYGGAAGGGKSSWLLQAALQYVDVPGYAAILFRRTFKQLAAPGALMDRSMMWLGGTDARWVAGENEWRFPSGAVLKFGFLDSATDWMNHQGPEYQFVGFDELTQFRERDYRYLFSRLRRPTPTADMTSAQHQTVEALSRVPLRMRAASNPGGPGHEWVKNRFGIYQPAGDPDPRRLCHRPSWVRDHDRAFLPANAADNPGLDKAAYRRTLAELDATTRAQLEHGDWDVREPGELFRREWFPIHDQAPDGCKWVRYWDLAATEPHDSNPDPDWTAGCKLGRHPNGTWWLADMRRTRRTPDGVEKLVAATAELDGAGVPVWIEQEPGASGKAVIQHYQRHVLPAFEVRAQAPSDSKGIRARPVSAKAQAGLVNLVRGDWLSAFLDEADAFPPDDGGHDDQIDALSGAFTALLAKGEVKRTPYVPGREPEVQRGGLTLVGDRYIDKE